MNSKYLNSDFRSLEIHKLIAKKIEKEPYLVKKAIANIDNWKKNNKNPQPYLDEWVTHIDKGLEHLLMFLVSETDEAQRLRSSSPFVGIITKDERVKIFKKFSDKNKKEDKIEEIKI